MDCFVSLLKAVSGRCGDRCTDNILEIWVCLRTHPAKQRVCLDLGHPLHLFEFFLSDYVSPLFCLSLKGFVFVSLFEKSYRDCGKNSLVVSEYREGALRKVPEFRVVADFDNGKLWSLVIARVLHNS